MLSCYNKLITGNEVIIAKEVIIVKEVISFDVSPVALFWRILFQNCSIFRFRCPSSVVTIVTSKLFSTL